MVKGINILSWIINTIASGCWLSHLLRPIIMGFLVTLRRSAPLGICSISSKCNQAWKASRHGQTHILFRNVFTQCTYIAVYDKYIYTYIWYEYIEPMICICIVLLFSATYCNKNIWKCAEGCKVQKTFINTQQDVKFILCV